MHKAKTTTLTQSLSVMADVNGDVTNNSDDFNGDDSEQSFESCGEDPDVSLEAFVTHPSSPAATGTMQTPMQSPLCAVSGTSINATAQKTRPCLSDVFTAHFPAIPALSAVTGLVQMPLVTLGPAPARPSVTFGVDFIQINCGKRISAMTLLGANTKNKIALIQEPYTSISGCTLLHKRDFFCWSTTPPCMIPTGAVPTQSANWTSLRPRAAICAPGQSDVLPVYRFMTRDIATVAIQLGFISSVYMDITKSVRSPELIALLDFCRQEQKTLIMALDCNAHSYLFSDCENNLGLEIDGLIAEYSLEVHNRGITPTFTGAGQKSTVNYSVVDITLSLNMPKDHKIEEWKVSLHMYAGRYTSLKKSSSAQFYSSLELL
jgi:hypothetical protein